MGPLASMFGQMKHSADEDHKKRTKPLPRANPYINPMLDDSPPLSDRTTFDRTPPFRDPAQAGPEPPVDPRILARLFGAP
jgi:hypothetical protein